MARHSKGVRTFSIGFVPGEESELGYARKVADAVQAEHHEFIQQADDFFSLLQRLVWHNDEPITFPASIPLYILSRESKRVATVMLGGEGADEILAGYGNNLRAYWLARSTAAVPDALLRLAAGLPLPGRLRALAARGAQDESERILGTFRLGEYQSIARASRIDLPDAVGDDALVLDEIGYDRDRPGSFLDRLLYVQLKTYLIALLMKQDKMSMAASIETRVPYLDHHLVELAFSLPDDVKIRGREGKVLLKQVSRGLIPDEIIDRPKRGFPVPIDRWFREAGNPFVEVLLDPGTLNDGFLDADFVRSRVKRFQSGEKLSMELWTMLNLELWRREYLGPADRNTARPA